MAKFCDFEERMAEEKNCFICKKKMAKNEKTMVFIRNKKGEIMHAEVICDDMDCFDEMQEMGE